MKPQEYLDAAWKYWGIDALPDKPNVEQLSDEDLYEVQLADTIDLPSQARQEVMNEWYRRRLRIKVYRDNSPRKR